MNITSFKSLSFVAMLSATLCTTVTSCSKDDDNPTNPQEEQPGTETQEVMDKACQQWKVARADWEWSEAFLFGAADEYSIDPHTDTWPVDQTSLANTLRDASIMNNISEKVKTLNSGILGYHGIEYVIFRNGAPRKVTDITDLEYKYVCAVALDLYQATSVLHTTWAGRNAVSEERYNITLDYLRSHNTINDDGDVDGNGGMPYTDFGYEFKNPGADSPYETHLDATLEIIAGAQDIISEVGGSKIGQPHTGQKTDYIESPYAYNSIIDFYDNIVGCRNALYGMKGATEPNEKSLIYFCKHSGNTTLAAQADAVVNALNTALDKINSMKAPFALYYADSSARTAMDALNVLDNELDKLSDILETYEDNEVVQNQCKVINANYVDNVIVATYSSLADNALKLYQTIVNIKK